MKFSKNAQIALSVFFLILIAMLGALFLAFKGISALEGSSELQFYADSATYHLMAEDGQLRLSSISDMVSISSNYLGPMLVLEITQNNYYAILIANILIFWAATELIARTFTISRAKLYAVLLINPITISSLLSVNKEIISLLALSLLLAGLVKRNLFIVLIAVGFGFLVRWQFALFELTIILLYSRFNPLPNQRGTTILAMLVVASIFLWQFGYLVESVQDNFNLAAETYEGSGLYTKLVELQNDGLYWLIFIPKISHLLFGLGVRLDRLITPVDIYNDVWQLLHSTLTLVVFLTLFAKKRLSIQSDLIYISVIYLIIFGITPIYAPRYFYPIYVLWGIALTTKHTASLRFVRTLSTNLLARMSSKTELTN